MFMNSLAEKITSIIMKVGNMRGRVFISTLLLIEVRIFVAYNQEIFEYLFDEI